MTKLYMQLLRLPGGQDAKIKLCASANQAKYPEHQANSGEIGSFEREREGGDGFQ